MLEPIYEIAKCKWNASLPLSMLRFPTFTCQQAWTPAHTFTPTFTARENQPKNQSRRIHSVSAIRVSTIRENPEEF